MKNEMITWVEQAQKEICSLLQNFEPFHVFHFEKWHRDHFDGFGTMATLRGDVFEKAGVNISAISGSFSEEFRLEIPGASKDGKFFACGLSIVIHPKNPFVPTAHMNTRFINTTQSWFGGGADLTPTFEFEQDTKDFHQTLKNVCECYEKGSYNHFKAWCDRYFFLPHRNELRGVGGIFYDYLTPEPLEKGFDFTKDVAKSFVSIYLELVQRHYKKTFTQEDKERQLIKRGRYVEFNLLYDRGTRFGLETKGNTDAILMSLPPCAKW